MGFELNWMGLEKRDFPEIQGQGTQINSRVVEKCPGPWRQNSTNSDEEERYHDCQLANRLRET